MSKESLYFDAIKSVISTAYDAQRPVVTGSLYKVFIVKSDEGDFACKFNHHDLALKNEKISNIFNAAGINAPSIKVHNFKNLWFETYPLLNGKTLYENVGSGISTEKLQSVYREIIDNFIKMDEINQSLLYEVNYKYTHQVAYRNISDTNNPIFGRAFSGIVQAMNWGKSADKGIYHCGITPKNVILNDQQTLSGFLDLDEVAIADKNYAFGMMAAKYQQLGQNIMDLIDYYEMKTEKKLNHKKIQDIAKLTNFGKHILWRNANRQKTK